ncbi:S49 family peptidase [Candidatus Pacearchaeota archaeon]|nr:S49 family peptidase [Candidatus Pacearchaeota archaeon]
MSDYKTLYNTPLLITQSFLTDCRAQEIKAAFVLDEIPEPAFEIFVKEVGTTAIILIHGPLEQRPSLFSFYFGGVSTEEIIIALNKTLENEEIERIILDIDSPGGSVDGIENLSNLIFEARKEKEIIAVANSMAASAALWIASAAGKFYISSSTATVGSIGVIAIHRDFSEQEKARGIKTTEIVSGKLKNSTSPHSPLTAAGAKELQERVDFVHSLFVGALVKNRNLDEKEVEKISDGRMFTGPQAQEAGLIDGIFSLETLTETSKNNTKETFLMAKENEKTKAGTASPPAVTLAYLEENHQEILTPLREKAHAEGMKLGREEGATAEKERIQAVEDNTLPGFEKITGPLKFDGKTTGPEVAAAVIAEQKKRGVSLEGIKGDSQGADFTPPASDEKTKAEKEKEDVKSIVAGANATQR